MNAAHTDPTGVPITKAPDSWPWSLEQREPDSRGVIYFRARFAAGMAAVAVCGACGAIVPDAASFREGHSLFHMEDAQ